MKKEALKQEKPKNNFEGERDCVADLFLEVGIDIKKINPNIVRRLRLLNKETQTFKDEERDAGFYFFS